MKNLLKEYGLGILYWGTLLAVIIIGLFDFI